MLSRFIKVLLVATSVAPVLLTSAFVCYLHEGPSLDCVSLASIAVGLGLLCALIVRAAREHLERIEFSPQSVRTADMEIVGFVIAYLLPLANASNTVIDDRVLLFVLGMFGLVVWGSHSYHFNPLLTLLGYHFYEVTTPGNVGFVMITRRPLREVGEARKVVQLTEYMVLDVGREA